MQKVLLVLILLCHFSFGQMMSDERIDESKILVWNAESAEDYEGMYFFGFSEVESQFTLSVDDEVVCAQLRSYEWVDNDHDEIIGWKPVYENYTNVRIKGNKFFSDQSNGEFVLYNGEKCLKLNTPPVQLGDVGDYELGSKGIKNPSEYYRGKYIETIFEIVEYDKLKSMSLHDLKIMRNEIFARYGYIFIYGGEMDTYFKKQDWYSGTHEDVSPFLSDIEKANIANIRKVEEEKKKG